MKNNISPWAWIPTLYFAEGIPYFIVNTISVIMFKNLGMSNGDIAACLDIERRPETIQGNIRRDRLRDVWEERFGLFRHDLSDLNAECRSCGHARFCRGDAHHSWDYDRNRPMVCFKGMLF